MMRRVIYVPFKNSLRDDEVDIDLSKKIKLHWHNLDLIFWMGRVAITQAKRRGYLCEMDESSKIKERYVDSRKSEVEHFKDYIEAEHLVTFDEWVLGVEGARCLGGMNLERAKKGGYGNLCTDDVWYAFLEYKELGGGVSDDEDETRARRDKAAEDAGLSRKATMKQIENLMDVTIGTCKTSKRIGGKTVNIRYYYR